MSHTSLFECENCHILIPITECYFGPSNQHICPKCCNDNQFYGVYCQLCHKYIVPHPIIHAMDERYINITFHEWTMKNPYGKYLLNLSLCYDCESDLKNTQEKCRAKIFANFIKDRMI